MAKIVGDAFNDLAKAATDATTAMRAQADAADKLKKAMLEGSKAQTDAAAKAKQTWGEWAKEKAGGVASGIGSAYTGGSAAIGMGMGKLNAFVGTAGQVSDALGRVGKAAALMGDHTLDAAQKSRHLAESLPMVGGIVSSLNQFRDGITGVTAKLQEVQIKFSKVAQYFAAEQQFAAEERSAKLQRVDARSRAEGLRGVAMVTQELGSTMTAQGQRDYSNTLAQQPALLAQRRAQADAAAQKAKLAEISKMETAEEGKLEAAKKRDRDLADRNNRMIIEQERAQRASRPQGLRPADAAAAAAFPVSPGAIGQRIGQRIGEWTSGQVGAAAGEDRVERLNNRVGIQTALNEQVQRQGNLLALAQQKQQAMTALAKAESDQRKAAIDLDKARVGVLDQQLGLIKAQGTSFGSLTAAEREAATQASKIAKTQGYGALSEDQKGLISRAGGSEYLQDQAFRNAQNDPRNAEFRANLGMPTGDYAKLEKDRNESQKRILEAVQVDEQKFADKLAFSIESVISKILDLLEKRLQTQKQAIENQIGAQNAAR